jgi:hypothetical protein
MNSAGTTFAPGSSSSACSASWTATTSRTGRTYSSRAWRRSLRAAVSPGAGAGR